MLWEIFLGVYIAHSLRVILTQEKMSKNLTEYHKRCELLHRSRYLPASQTVYLALLVSLWDPDREVMWYESLITAYCVVTKTTFCLWPKSCMFSISKYEDKLSAHNEGIIYLYFFTVFGKRMEFWKKSISVGRRMKTM